MNDQDSQSSVFVVFGGTGDLMSRKLIPALVRLKNGPLRNTQFQVIGVARDSERTEAAYREWVLQAVEASGLESDSAWCNECVHYQTINGQNPGDFRTLLARIQSIEKKRNQLGNRLFYLALPPSSLEHTIQQLGECGLNRSNGWNRLVVEKPFGRDLLSAIQLNRSLHEHFREDQIYRIDHYLGKETVQNLLVFRFANLLFESAWNRDRVRSVEVVVAEELGLGSRAGYYDRSGALRDMVQNHLTQLLCLTAMEAPATFEANHIRDEKVKVLRSIAPIDLQSVVYGQYDSAVVDGQALRGYHQEEGVPQGSTTETFVSLRLEIANWRWQGVPFLLRTGKRLKRRLTRIKVQFRCPPVSLFHPFTECQVASNELVITLQPNEGFDLHFEVKSPGQDISMQTEQLGFKYAEKFGPLPEAYETLLLDVLTGDQTLFVRGDEAEAAWELYQPLLENPPSPFRYPAGSWGPERAGFFLE